MALALVALVVATVVSLGSGVRGSGDCAICIKILGQLYDGVPKEERGDHLKIEEHIDRMCQKAKPNTEARRVCYSIETLKRKVSMPMKNGLPVDVICKKLAKADEDICNIREIKEVDLRDLDLKKMRVRQIRNLLSEHDLHCKGCREKAEFVKMLQEQVIDKLPPRPPPSDKPKEEL
mmetsp:Transcript_46191/g.113336  ORF Transcript_46191/g.113336 Transcript_46191/m.113336 type:complete len:177 (+) Transcript_46191:84-614(+)